MKVFLFYFIYIIYMIYVYIYVEHVYVFICTNQYVCMQQLGCPFKIRKLSVSKQENLLSHSSGGWQSEMTVSAGFQGGEGGSVPGTVSRFCCFAGHLWLSLTCEAPFCLCLHLYTVLSRCVCLSLGLNFPLLIKTFVILDWGPP